MEKLKINEFFSQSPSLATIVTGINLQKALNQELKKHGLNLFSAMIVVAIFFEKEKVLRPSALYELLPLTKGNISHMTSGLESQKIIQRYLSSDDLRGYEFKLTNKGEKLALELIKFFNHKEDEAEEIFSKSEVKKLLEFLRMLK